jgi:hypothetical protein
MIDVLPVSHVVPVDDIRLAGEAPCLAHARFWPLLPPLSSLPG